MRLATVFRYFLIVAFAAVTIGFHPTAAQATGDPVTVTAPTSGTIITAGRTSSPTFYVSYDVQDNASTNRIFELLFVSGGNAVAKFSWRSTSQHQTMTFGLTNTKFVFNGSSYQPLTVTWYSGSPTGWLANRVVPGTYTLRISSAVDTGGDASTFIYSPSVDIPNITIAAPNGVKCSPGTYNSGGRWTARALCVFTSAGYYTSTAGATTQRAASAGYFSVGKGNPVAVKCNYGTYQPKAGKTTCLLASAGYFVAQQGLAAQTPCPKGRFSASIGLNQCQMAQPGHYVSAVAQKHDNPCLAGTFSSSPGAIFCDKAPVGFIVAASGAIAATACDLGSYQDKTGQRACKLTTPGHYQDLSGQSRQHDCPAGYFNTTAGQRVCLAAEPGTYIRDVAQTSARDCPAGTFQAAEGQDHCDRAPLGSFTASARSTAPNLCPTSMYSDVLGARSCKPCPTGQEASQPGAVSLSACLPVTIQSRGLYIRN